MVFYIIEQGARYITPVDKLLTPPVVSPVSEPTAVKAVDQGLSEQPPPISQYNQQQSETTAPRAPAIYAEQIMSKPVITALSSQSIASLSSICADQGIHHLPLVNRQKQLQGIVSDRDLLRAAANKSANLDARAASVIMSERVITAGATTEIRTLAEVMCLQKIGAIPIVDDSAQLIGIVTRSDILRTVVHTMPLEIWT